ncbi:MAG TPA: hypothetical protein VIC05_03405 [Solirubrobacteraceae bacterium]
MSMPRWLPVGALTAGALMTLWLLVEPRTPDMAAQVYRVELFQRAGFTLWDERWYAGHHIPGYSLLYPALGSVVGMNLLAVLCVLASSLIFQRIAYIAYGPSARFGIVWFAVAASCDVWVGRLTFALGVTLALAAVYALLTDRGWIAALLAGLSAAASPLVGVFLILAALSNAFSARRMGARKALIMPVAIVVLALALLFPEGGFEPYPMLSFLATVVVTLAFMWGLPTSQPTLRLAAVVYLFACAASLLVHTPMGSNIERYGVLLAGPLLACSLTPARVTLKTGLVFCVIALWTVWGPVREIAAVAGSNATRASYYLPIRRFLERHAAQAVRIEVPFTRSHWEAALLAPYVSLARGWERQLDKRYDQAIEAAQLSPAIYEQWLQRNAVSYVALPDVTIDGSSRGEAALITAGTPYLHEVLHTVHWRLFAVAKPTPLASPPAAVKQMGEDAFTLRFARPGTSLVRVRYTRYLTGRGVCVRRGQEGWTTVSSTRAGVITIAARFSLGRALGLSSRCSDGS